MSLKKIFLITSVCAATLATTNLYATAIVPSHKTTTQDSSFIKNTIISNLDSLFPFQTHVTVGKVDKNSNGDITASDILIVSNGNKNPNVSIDKLVVKGLKVNQKINNDVSIKVEGLKVTNLASAVANSNAVSAKVDSKKLSGDNNLYKIAMNAIGKSVYNFEIEYDHSDSILKFELDSTINKKTFFKEDFELTNFDLSDTTFDNDFLASLKNKVMSSKIKNLNFDANFSEVLKETTLQYLGKDYKQTPNLDINGSLGKSSGEFELNVDGSLGSQSHVKYNLVADGIDLENTQMKDIINGSNVFWKNAYIQTNTADIAIELSFDKDSFSKKSPVQKILNLLDKKQLNIKITSDSSYKDSKYNNNFNITAEGLSNLSASTKAVVNGKLDLLPYLGVTDKKHKNLYNCNNQLCLTNIDFSFVNNGLLEKVARYTNKDPNTTPQQILGSYGALLQLFAVQQQNQFLRKALSSFAMFLQNTKNISIHAKANKPVNQTALLNMLIDDTKSLKKHNPMENNGRVDLSKSPNIKLINDIQKIFKITFDVNS
ncbi:hypothetical protein fh0823_04970 [Francisella halioticida]|uniref:Uncharacterized protein n=1 Tax=Francisella halioticida TaxID=549298 RepID=A0ABN5AX51_9GAMM|nr:hypothetical protein [Francisella halioticida]ASG68075.1 hypothetical protein CDV26_06465 [Francisella halioticida]BCD90358.1 hypothetical protein fh0823_04970 [Francisella halioticida]